MFGIEIPAWAIGVGFIILAGSLGGAVKRLLSGESGLPRPGGKISRRDLGQMVGDFKSRLGEVEELRSRLGELEERVDFAERLLAKQRDAERLAPPHSGTS